MRFNKDGKVGVRIDRVSFVDKLILASPQKLASLYHANGHDQYQGTRIRVKVWLSGG